VPIGLLLGGRRTLRARLLGLSMATMMASALSLSTGAALLADEIPSVPEESSTLTIAGEEPAGRGTPRLSTAHQQQPADEISVPDQAPQRLPNGGLPSQGFADDLKPIGAVKLNISPTRGELPSDHAAPRFALEASELNPVTLTRQWEIRTCEWDAPMSRHFPLLFEETNLERYGYHFGVLQPVISGVNFYTNIAVAPYKGYTRRYCDPVYTLGHYRPGNCVPYQWHLYKFDPKAAALYGGTIAGGIILIP